jgi:hypothetical protein
MNFIRKLWRRLGQWVARALEHGFEVPPKSTEEDTGNRPIPPRVS